MSKVTELKERFLTLEKASLEDVLGGSASYEALAAARQELVGGLKEPRELVDYLAQEIAEIDEELDSQRSPDPDRILAPKEIQALLGRQSELWERLQVAQRKAPSAHLQEEIGDKKTKRTSRTKETALQVSDGPRPR